MELNEFISHIKHKSLNIIIYDPNGKILFSGSIGEFETSVIRQKIGNYIVDLVRPGDTQKSKLAFKIDVRPDIQTTIYDYIGIKESEDK